MGVGGPLPLGGGEADMSWASGGTQGSRHSLFNFSDHQRGDSEQRGNLFKSLKKWA